MRTSKPISTVSYNTPAFFEGTCDRLLKSKIISFYAFIVHKGEDDESGKKDHIHAYFELSKTVQTDDLKEMFIEPDPTNTKPLCCLNFRPSKFAEWYQYGLHDPYYLMQKGMERKFSYKHEDIITSSEEELHALSYDVVGKPSHNLYNIIERCVSLGMPFNEIVAHGFIPPMLLGAGQVFYSNLMTYKYDKLPEDPKYEVVTGEETYCPAEYLLGIGKEEE